VVGYKQGVGGAVRDLFTQSSGAPINFFSKLLKKLLLIVYVYVAGLRRLPAHRLCAGVHDDGAGH